MRSKLILIVIFAAISIVLDQYTKILATRYLLGAPDYSWLQDFFVLTYSINHGAFLGMGSTWPESLRTFIFSGLVGIFLLGFLIYCLRTPFTHLQNISAGLILGGGGSNLFDRVTNHGGVVDFMNMGFGNLIRTGIFNVADMAIMLGVFLLLISFMREENKKATEKKSVK